MLRKEISGEMTVEIINGYVRGSRNMQCDSQKATLQ